LEICTLLGRLGQASAAMAGGVSYPRSLRHDIGRGLYNWITQLPPDLRLKGALDYDVRVRQLHLPYFTALSILYRPEASLNSYSVAAVLASSSVARIFEDFIARDELKYLGSYVAFHLLVAILPQLYCFRVPSLSDISKSEIGVIRSSLLQVGKTWHSARRTLRVLDRLLESARRSHPGGDELGQINTTADELSYFATIEPDLCPKWNLIVSGDFISRPPPSPLPGMLGMLAGRSSSSTQDPLPPVAAELEREWVSNESREQHDPQFDNTATLVSGAPGMDWKFGAMDESGQDDSAFFDWGSGWILDGWEANLA